MKRETLKKEDTIPIMKICYRPIGLIRSRYKKRQGVPIQGALVPDSRGRVEVFPEYQDGLKDIEGFSHIILLYHFNLAGKYRLLEKPYLEEKRHGIFSIRGPRRPNPIGISVVKLERRAGNILYVSEVDVIDGTPLLDIKPYVSGFDSRSNVKDGWLTERLKHAAGHKSDSRHGR
jgi:tRNA-Thr(GGU) m(6)t(6)A37 methyltransferase TsaA